MSASRRAVVFAFALLALSGARAAPPFERVWYGGGLGVSLGDTDNVYVAPMVGFRITRKLSTGIGLSWVRRDYEGSSDQTTDDVGVDLFGRYAFHPRFFGQAQYSYTEFEFPLLSGGTDDDAYSAMLVGGGWVQRLGGRAAFVLSALYDVTYDDDQAAPYDDPWVLGAGFVFGF